MQWNNATNLTFFYLLFQNHMAASLSYHFETKFLIKIRSNVKIQSQVPTDEPCLQVIDYMNWAIYRAFTRGDMGYFQTIEEKVSLLVDLYDTQKYPKNWYNRRNKFDLTKITPL